MSNDRAPLLRMQGIAKRFGGQRILEDFAVEIGDGEFFTILGPSGCGKTTVLRLIAGLDSPDAGQIDLDGKDIATLPPEHRPINTVFQSYALFPHMTVAENVAFGLKMRKVPAEERARRVAEALQLVHLSPLADRKPGSLSGGQQQRVAIARAVVNRPRMLLLDESLSALDFQLRQKMQVELKHLQRELGISFVYVTHDQSEALAMSDRVMVMHAGRVQQVGTPREVYETPANLFVAGFIGETNTFPAVITANPEPGVYLAAMAGEQDRIIHSKRHFAAGQAVRVLLRPEDLRILTESPAQGTGFHGRIAERSYTGKTIDAVIELDVGFTVTTSEFFDENEPDFDYDIGASVWVDWVHGWEHVLPEDANTEPPAPSVEALHR